MKFIEILLLYLSLTCNAFLTAKNTIGTALKVDGLHFFLQCLTVWNMKLV